LPSSSLQGVSSLILFPLFATGVVDTGGKFAAGVVDTGGKFAAGVNDNVQRTYTDAAGHYEEYKSKISASSIYST
jgi:hypothetical protein